MRTINSKPLFAIEEKRPSSVLIVIDRIKELLVREELRPGDKIPSESALAESLKISRGPIREALKILSGYGIVEIQRGKGTFVSTASNHRIFDPLLFQLLVQERDYPALVQVRRILEEGIVKLVIESASESELQDLCQVSAGFLRELNNESPSSEKAKDLDIQYHTLLGKLSHNSIIENMYNFIIVLFSPTIFPIHEGVCRVHADLQKAIMTRDIKWAVDEIDHHTEIWIKAYEENESGVALT